MLFERSWRVVPKLHPESLLGDAEHFGGGSLRVGPLERLLYQLFLDRTQIFAELDSILWKLNTWDDRFFHWVQNSMNLKTE